MIKLETHQGLQNLLFGWWPQSSSQIDDPLQHILQQTLHFHQYRKLMLPKKQSQLWKWNLSAFVLTLEGRKVPPLGCTRRRVKLWLSHTQLSSVCKLKEENSTSSLKSSSSMVISKQYSRVTNGLSRLAPSPMTRSSFWTASLLAEKEKSSLPCRKPILSDNHLKAANGLVCSWLKVTFPAFCPRRGKEL